MTRTLCLPGDKGPGGLEGVAIAIAGTGLRSPLSETVSCGLELVAGAIEGGLHEIAEAIAER